jgi:tetratricopeptide (TPR) repeat protein
MEPRNAEAYRALGRAYEALNRIEDAESTYRKAIQLQPDSWNCYWDLAVFLSNRAHYDQAVKQFEKVIQLAPDSYRAYASLGATLLYLGEYRSAEENLIKSIDITPSHKAYSNLSACYILQKRYPEAVSVLEKAIKMESADYQNWANLGDAYSQIPSLSKKAPEAFARAASLVSRDLEVNPHSTILRAKRAFFLARSGNKEQALEDIAQIEELTSKDAEVLFWTAIVYEAAGNREKALDCLAEAIKGGFSSSLIEDASDLIQLRKDPRYQRLLGKQSPP